MGTRYPRELFLLFFPYEFSTVSPRNIPGKGSCEQLLKRNKTLNSIDKGRLKILRHVFSGRQIRGFRTYISRCHNVCIFLQDPYFPRSRSMPGPEHPISPAVPLYRTEPTQR